MIGGAASSPLWPAIVADVTGLPLSLPQALPEQDRRSEHWPAVGAAILAGVGVDAFETAAAGWARFQRPARQIEPDPATMPLYDQSFSTYQQFVCAGGWRYT
jgi:sugar (pentulose or hexulose) kinase